MMEELIRHAKRFGVDGVMETAAESWRLGRCSFEQVVSLQKEVDTIQANPTRRHAAKTKHRLTAEVRVKRLLGITEEEPTDG